MYNLGRDEGTSVCPSVLQARSKLSHIQDSQHEVSKSIEQCNNTLNGTHGGSMTNLADMSETCFGERENGGFPSMVRGAQVSLSGVCEASDTWGRNK